MAKKIEGWARGKTLVCALVCSLALTAVACAGTENDAEEPAEAEGAMAAKGLIVGTYEATNAGNMKWVFLGEKSGGTGGDLLRFDCKADCTKPANWKMNCGGPRKICSYNIERGEMSFDDGDGAMSMPLKMDFKVKSGVAVVETFSMGPLNFKRSSSISMCTEDAHCEKEKDILDEKVKSWRCSANVCKKR